MSTPAALCLVELVYRPFELVAETVQPTSATQAVAMVVSASSSGGVENLVLQFASPTAIVPTDKARRMAMLVEVCKSWLRRKALAFVALATGRPLLSSYSSDGTPLTTRERWHHRAGDQHIVHRHGGASHEFLIQRLFLAFRSDGELRLRTLVSEPVPLTKGKGASQVFACGRVFFPVPPCGGAHRDCGAPLLL